MRLVMHDAAYTRLHEVYCAGLTLVLAGLLPACPEFDAVHRDKTVEGPGFRLEPDDPRTFRVALCHPLGGEASVAATVTATAIPKAGAPSAARVRLAMIVASDYGVFDDDTIAQGEVELGAEFNPPDGLAGRFCDPGYLVEFTLVDPEGRSHADVSWEVVGHAYDSNARFDLSVSE
ncbi:MAG: hypothetical protein JNK45_02955 [Myxococcales bacterium]|nr:hypothetical protein [Myxococcales bacterium]